MSNLSLKILTITFFILFFMGKNVNFKNENKEIDQQKTEHNIFKNEKINYNVPMSIKLYNEIEKWSDKYNIPKYIAYNVAYKETRYKGPFHWDYNHKQISSAGAIGPMQIMPATARLIQKTNVPNNLLINDTNLNVKISMKLLNRLYNKYGDWGVVCGAYNTGKPIVNGYAIYCINNKNYAEKWVDV